MWTIIVLVIGLGLIGTVIGLTIKSNKKATLVLTIIIGFFSVIMFFKTIVVIDAGETGITVLFGKVDKDYLENGLHSINPLAKVVTYPLRLRQFGATGSNMVEARAKDGLTVSLEISILYSITPDKVPYIYGEVAKNISNLEEDIFKPSVRTIIRNITAIYSTDEIYSNKREELGQKIKERVVENLSPNGMNIDSVLIRKIILPNQVDDAIQKKLAAQQEAEAMDFKKVKAQKQAEIKIIEAEGLAKAQRIINSTLTPTYLQHEAIEAYKELAGSDNSTFVIMPTSTKGAGMPLILNAQTN